MARYDLYPSPTGEGYLLDVQSNLLAHLHTRVIVPVMPPEMAPLPGRRLNPSFVVDGSKYVMVTQFISAVMASELMEAAGNLDSHHDEIVAALDMLFQGF